MANVQRTWVEAREPISNRRREAGVVSALGEWGRVWLFVPEEYDERVWPPVGWAAPCRSD
ncbi:MAG: hypothetical protein ACJ72W_24275 [Actinoallomurus sp.]